MKRKFSPSSKYSKIECEECRQIKGEGAFYRISDNLPPNRWNIKQPCIPCDLERKRADYHGDTRPPKKERSLLQQQIVACLEAGERDYTLIAKRLKCSDGHVRNIATHNGYSVRRSDPKWRPWTHEQLEFVRARLHDHWTYDRIARELVATGVRPTAVLGQVASVVLRYRMNDLRQAPERFINHDSGSAKTSRRNFMRIEARDRPHPKICGITDIDPRQS